MSFAGSRSANRKAGIPCRSVPGDPKKGRKRVRAEELLTRSLKEALALVGVKTLDHLIISGDWVISSAEEGLI